MKSFVTSLIFISTLIVISGCGPSKPVDVQEQLGSLNTQASEAYQNRDYAAALIPAGEAANLAHAEYGPHHPQTLSNLTHLALLYAMTGQFESSEALYERELSINRRVYGPNHPKTLISLNNLGINYVSLGHFESAEALFEEALRINENDDIHRITTLNNVAYLHLVQGRFAEVEPIYQQVQKIHQDGGGILDPGTLAGQDRTTWVVSIVVGREDGDGGFAIDCSMFRGGTGPFNPDPESGGPLAQCGPFGTMPIYGMWGDWFGDGFGSGDGGPPDPPGGGGNDGGGGGDSPGLSDEEKDSLPDGIEEDFNGCATHQTGSDRDACCSQTASGCAELCTTDAPGEFVVCTWTCEDAEVICKAGDEL